VRFDVKLDSIVTRYKQLSQALASGTIHDPKDIAKLSKEFSDLREIAGVIEKFQATQKEAQDIEALLKDPSIDPDLKAIAESEMLQLKQTLLDLEHHIKVLLLPKDADDERNAILEIRAGTGGEEAALFGADLMRMYQRYAEYRGWRVDILSLSETGIGGVKEASMNISGKGVFSRLKFESGVHRVQRVPITEASGRIHTSAATVAVLPEVEEVDIDIRECDLRIDTFRSQGAGGQHVNTTDSAVRITHIPSGVVVSQQDEKSQHKNKAKALKILRARLYEFERQKRESARAAERKDQIGSGDRSERIRTYNFPQGRVTDHRIGLTLYKLDLVMNGTALDELIDALIAHDQAQKLGQADD
jgi:peptide chain release factor 1